jgi:hypothetical protein
MVLLSWLALALSARAQDEPPQPPADQPAEAAADESEAEPSGDDAEESAIEEFIFSEEIPADQQLVFPVDI